MVRLNSGISRVVVLGLACLFSWSRAAAFDHREGREGNEANEHSGGHSEADEHSGGHNEANEHSGGHSEADEHSGGHSEADEHSGGHNEANEHSGSHSEADEHSEGTDGTSNSNDQNNDTSGQGNSAFELKATLKAPANMPSKARGKVGFRSVSAGARQFELEVSGLPVSRGTAAVYVDDVLAGKARITRGRVKVRVRSSKVPHMTAGSIVKVKNEFGPTMAAGTLR